MPSLPSLTLALSSTNLSSTFVTQCGPRTSTISIIWKHIRNVPSWGLTLDLGNQEVLINKIPECIECMLLFKKRCSTAVKVIFLNHTSAHFSPQ